MTGFERKYVSYLTTRIRSGDRRVCVAGLSGTALSYFLSELLSGLDRPCLVIHSGRKEAELLYKELQFFLSIPAQDSGGEGSRLHGFAPYDMSPLSGLSPSRELVTRRIEALYAALSLKNPIVITSLDAVAYRTLPKEVFVRAMELIQTGEMLERDPLLRRLESNGYQRTSLVEDRGDYAVRGGVIDIFPPLQPLPLRLELWGDHLESIRRFDPITQRSQAVMEEAVVLPASEVIMDRDTLSRARSMGRLPKGSEDGLSFPGQEAWLNHFYDHLDTLIGYLSPDTLIVEVEPNHFGPKLLRLHERFETDVARFRQEAAEKGTPFPETDGLTVLKADFSLQESGYQRVEFSALDLPEGGADCEITRIATARETDAEIEVRLSGKGRVSLAPLAETLTRWLDARGQVVLVSRTEQQAGRLKEILQNYDVMVDQTAESWSQIPRGPGLTLCLGRLRKGFAWEELGLYVLSEDEIFGPKKARSRGSARPSENVLSWSSFGQLKAGDPVVHEDHGIGRYCGLVKMEVGEKVNDFVIIEYGGGDKLYIPADRISILQKYVGAEDSDPKLDRLGGRAWDLVKKKARSSVQEIARQLVELYALRKYRQGFAYSPPDHVYREFEAGFEHEETSDQVKAIDAVLEDMASERPMDRLICGDVGFGKTEVAIRAAFKAVSDGKQVALLVPTTVLAEQHYETLKKRMAPYGVKIGIVSRFKSKAEQTETLGQLLSGALNVLIGTHRMLQKDVRFKDLGLLVIDEEQRFGVKQKESIKRYRSMVDVLALTATPIPRTFQMSLMGVRDLSVIETPPEDRLAIQTSISHYDESMIRQAILSEKKRGGQVFFVHNKVQTIDFMADKLRVLVPEARFEVAHGQMVEKQLERAMMRFLKKEIDVLVCTTIIESGLDIPSANTIIINEADRFGLGQIYQLRGRVGRSREKAHAYLFLSNGAALTKDAEKRLKALMDFSHLGAGLHLAMHDLKIRGGGNILGFAQSGHITAVGYELYVKLIEEAVAELKGEAWHETVNPEINVKVSAYLPSDYVIDTDVRLSLYRRLSLLREKHELAKIREEIHDRFGPVPEPVRHLFDLMSLRLLMKEMGISRLDVGNDALTLSFSQSSPVDPAALVRLVSGRPRQYQFLSDRKLKIHLGPLDPSSPLKRVEKALEAMAVLSSGPQRDEPAHGSRMSRAAG